jgi:hypothetical protein
MPPLAAQNILWGEPPFIHAKIVKESIYFFTMLRMIVVS